MNGKILKEWIKKAEQDRSAANVLIRQRKLAVYDIVCFHCQQCVEKYLKAYLTSINQDFPKTHDLMELVDLAVKGNGAFELIRDLIKPLGKFAIRFRYPGEESRSPQAKQATQIMEKARAFILDLLADV